MMENVDGACELAELRDFFEWSPTGKAVTSSEGAWLRVNAALATMLGYSVEELKATSFLALTHPDEMPEALDDFRALVADERQNCSPERRLRAKDGGYVCTQVTIQPCRGVDGTAPRFVMHFLDIRERKQSDEDLRASEIQYRRLFESAKDGILILAEDSGAIVDVNPFMTELTDYHYCGKPHEAGLGGLSIG